MDAYTQALGMLTREYDRVAPLNGHEHAVRCMRVVRGSLVRFAWQMSVDEDRTFSDLAEIDRAFTDAVAEVTGRRVAQLH